MSVRLARTSALPTASDETESWSGHMSDDGGSTLGPEPCASLTASPAYLELKGTRGEYRVPRTAVTKITRGKLYPWFFNAVRIHHSVATLSNELQFKPLAGNWEEIASALRRLGQPLPQMRALEPCLA